MAVSDRPSDSPSVSAEQADPPPDLPDTLDPAPGEKPAEAYIREAVNKHGVATRVFLPAAILVGAFVLLAAIFPDGMQTAISAANTTVVNSIGWYYVVLVFAFVVFALFMGLSRFGEIKLGRDDDKPEFGLIPWFAMLFAAGMGIGLVFWGVAEPLNHFASPPPGVDGAPEALAQSAMTTTFLHWGLHAWSIYIIVGLGVAYAVHRRGRPVSIRWALEPLLGDRVKGIWGDVIDVVAIVGTLFGVATSLGFGVAQISAGLDYLGVAEDTPGFQQILVVAITLVATISVATGIGNGIKWLSNFNLLLAAGLLITLLALGPTLFVAREVVQNVGAYLQNFLQLSFRTFPFRGNDGAEWLGAWTTYYWGWWISWSPFVGIFIARISRGRTIREFVFGVLLVPTLLTVVWFSVLGGSALYRELNGGGLVAEDGSVDTNLALFQLLDSYPGAAILSGLFVLLIIVFFVTSSDSGSYVVDMMASGGDPNPPLWSRVFWALLEGAICFVALLAGGAAALSALQTMAILVAAPFTIVMILMILAILKAAHAHLAEIRRLERRALVRELQREVEEGLISSGVLEAHPREDLPDLPTMLPRQQRAAKPPKS
ncbi:BCCT family transporter [Granulicoccus sp. GXG6511]|uniref:BCCT family transporter n=1 Tax=Granulicoccus sp. GXG6511 TaxID=3381351 RepID=UPI003D7D6DD8